MEGLTIDPELRRLMRPLTKDEKAMLHESLAAEGCRDPLAVWRQNGNLILLDGHNRHEWMLANGKSFDTYEVPGIETRADAIRWVARNQRARRNCSPEELAYLRGERYLLEKKTAGRPAKGSHGDTLSGKTANRIAEEDGVGTATVHRDAEYAAAIDSVAEVNEEAKTAILTGKSKVSRKDIKRVAALPKKARAKAAKKIAAGTKVKPEKRTKATSGPIAKNQERWSAIQKAVRGMAKALLEAEVIQEDGALGGDIERLVKDGLGVTSSPATFAATLDSVRRAVVALAPLVRESYGKAEK